MHEFCKSCIDVWIQRQGLAASCPLCKRMLVPSVPGTNATSRGGVAAGRGEAPEDVAEESEAMLEPLRASDAPDGVAEVPARVEEVAEVAAGARLLPLTDEAVDEEAGEEAGGSEEAA